MTPSPFFEPRDWHRSMFLSTKAASNLENWSITLQHKDFANSRRRRWRLLLYSWLTWLWLITLNSLLQQCFVILVDISLIYCLQWRERERVHWGVYRFYHHQPHQNRCRLPHSPFISPLTWSQFTMTKGAVVWFWNSCYNKPSYCTSHSQWRSDANGACYDLTWP